MSVKKL